MKVLHWKKRYLPEASWAAYSPGVGITYPIARSKDEMAVKLATMGYEFDGLDPSDPDSNGAIEVWTVRKFPGNSLGKDRRQC